MFKNGKNKTKFDKYHEEWLALAMEGISFAELSRRYKCKDQAIALRVRWMAAKRNIVIPKSIKVFRNKEDIYFDKVVRASIGCWGWKGYTKSGYGYFRYKNKDCAAHVFSYTLHKGETNGLYVCHTCDNPICSNPDHLFLGTCSDNSIDMRNKGRMKSIKLTPQKAAEIKYLISNGEKVISIAKKYSVSGGTIRGIRNGSHWGDIKAAKNCE